MRRMVIFGIQGMAGALQRREPFAHTGQQQTRRLGELQGAAIALEQPAGEMLFKRGGYVGSPHFG